MSQEQLNNAQEEAHARPLLSGKKKHTNTRLEQDRINTLHKKVAEVNAIYGTSTVLLTQDRTGKEKVIMSACTGDNVRSRYTGDGIQYPNPSNPIQSIYKMLKAQEKQIQTQQQRPETGRGAIFLLFSHSLSSFPNHSHVISDSCLLF